MHTLKSNSLSLPSSFVGFDDLLNHLKLAVSGLDNAGYPPHNLVKLDDDTFLIELAVAGFAEGDLTAQIENRVLTIKGERKDEPSPGTFVYRGIAARSFTRQFVLSEHIKVKSASLNMGILRIELVREVPEHLKLQRIAIGQAALPAS